MNLKNISKKVKAVVLFVAVLTTSIPVGFLTSGIVKAEGEDVTDSSEITYNYDQFMMKYTLKDNTTTGDFSYDAATHTYTWPTGVGVNQVKEISGRVAFSIPGKEGGTTEVKKGNHLTFTLPEVLSLNEGTNLSLMTRLNGVDTQIGTYSISGNTIIVNLDSEFIGKEGIDITSCFVAYSASINKDKIGTETMNRHSLAIKTGEECAIAIPSVPTELKTIKKSGEVLSDNSVKWTIELGDANDTGVVLAGGTVLDILDGQQTFTKAYLGTDEANTIAFTQDTTDTNKYSYTFPADSTLTAPLTITVITHPTDAVMTANPTSGEDISLSNNAKYIPAGKDESAALSVSEAAIAKIHKATVTKTAEVVDGNTLRWKIDLNDNKANVWRAVVKDVLSKGLTVDEEYGIHVLDKDTNEEKVLTSGKKSDTVSGVEVSYDVATAEGKQTLSVNYNSTFSHEYLITFHTKVDGNEYKGTASIDNIAYVETSYPTGGGKGGASIEYGSPNCHMDFLNAFVKIEATSDHATALKTGVLSWKATPSTKMSTSVYAGGVLKLSLGEGHGFVNDNLSTLKVYGKDGTELATSKYTTALSEGAIVINFSDTSLDINGVYVTFDTKASTYFADDEKHDYIAYADFSLKDDEGHDYPAKQAKVKQTLKNNMTKKTVSSKYDTANKEALFTFEIAVNANELSLTGVDVTDDLSSVLYALDASKVGSDGKITSTENATPLDKSFYEVRSVSSANDGTVLNNFAIDGKVTVHYDSLNKKDTVTIVVGLTETGKAKLKYDEALSEKVIFANNKATVTAAELDREGISSTVTGTGKNEIAVNKVVVKSGEQLQVGGQNTSTLQWGVNINSMGADLGSAPVITDTIPDGLTLDKKSVKLYLASYGEHGTIISGKGSEVPASAYSFNSVKKKDGTTVLTVNLPTDAAYKNASYGLVYETAISGTANAYSNSLEFAIDSKTAAANASVTIKAISYGVGTVRAFLTMTKTDELSPSTGVKGAKYGIFESEKLAKGGNENDTIDVGYTNDKGQITFTVPGTISGTLTYYLRELEAPTCSDKNGGLYKKDDTVYTIGGVTYGRKNIGKTGVGDSNNFVDEREKDIAKTGEVNVTNIFKDDMEGNKTSSFELYIKGEGKNQRVYVEKLSEGNYKFLGFVDDASKSAKISVVPSTKKGENSEGGMKISGLPWGEYELVQKTTADGFVLANKTSFAIKTNDAGDIVNPDDVTVENKKTIFTVKDATDGVAYKITESGEGGRTWELSSEDLMGEEKTYTGEMIQGNTYTISETTVPDGYKRHENVEVKNFDGNEVVTITETPIDIRFVLKDQLGNTLSDTEGSLKDVPSVVGCGKSYDITATIKDAVKDQYLPVDGAKVTVKISDDGDSAIVTPSDKSVMDASYSGNTVTVVVQKVVANVLIKEVDESTVISGGKFELYNATTNEKIGDVITDSNSLTELKKENADITNLPVGNYYLKEVEAPSGYLILDNNATYPFTVTNKDKNLKETEVGHNGVFLIEVKHETPAVDNTVTAGTSNTRFGVRLANEYSAILGGGKFEILNESGTKVMDFTSKSLESNGIVDIQGLAPGKYTIRETDALTVNDVTYAKDDSGLTFTLNADNTVKVEKLNDVTIFLRAYDKNMAQNDTVKAKEKNELLGAANSTKKNKVATLTYTVCPTFVQFDVKVRYNEDCNENASDTAYVKGITYGVFKDEACTDGKKVAEATTDENGNVLVGGLPTGSYYVKMIAKDAANVVDDTNTYKVEVTGYKPNKLQHLNGTEIGTSATGKVISELNLEVNRGDVNLTKTDAEDKNVTLAGSTYAIYRRTSENVETITDYKAPTGISSRYKIFAKNFSAMVMGVPGLNEIMGANSVAAADSEWTLITTSTTDATGNLKFNNVDVGVEYMIKELSEPSGYQVSKDPILVKLVKDAGTGKVTLTSSNTGNGTASIENGSVTWKEPRLKVGIELTDESGNALSGGTLELYDDAGNKIASWNTDGTRKIFSGELTGGKSYVIKQTKAIDGYISSNDVRFTAERKALAANDPYVQVVTVVNKKIVSSSGNAQTQNDASETAAKTKKKSPKTGEWF